MRKLLTILTSLLVLTCCPSISLCGYALEFDGEDDYVSLDHRALDGLENCTVEYWVYITEEDVGATTISGASDNLYNEYLHWFDFDVGFRPHQKQALVDFGEFPIDEWFHLVMTRDGDTGEAFVYFNGEEVGEGEYAQGDLDIAEDGLVLGQEQDAVGGGFDPNQCLLGQMDELRIWNYVRSEEQIQDTWERMVDPDTEGLVAYYRFDEGEGQELTDLTENEYHGRLGEDDDEDDGDPTWVESEAPISGGELEISSQEITFNPLLPEDDSILSLDLKNVSEEDDEAFTIEYEFRHIGDSPDWFEFSDEDSVGAIAPGDSVEISFLATAPEDVGLYEHSILLATNSMNIGRMEIPVTLWVVEGFGFLTGEVIDPERNEGIPGAYVHIVGEYEYEIFTDENGDFEFEDEFPAAEYQITIIADNYLPYFGDFEVDVEEEVDLSIEMLYAQFDSESDIISEELEPPPDTLSIEFTISNEGNGPLTWSLENQFPAPAIEAWTYLDTVLAEQETEDARLEGVVFANDYYYISGSDGDDFNYIYILNQDGELQDSFTQPDSSRSGMTDLAFDGELIWGAKGREIFGISTDGEVNTTIEGPFASIRNVAWDPDRNLLWVSGTTTDIIGLDGEGDEIVEVNLNRMRVYGIAYWPDDPDDYGLYVLHEVDDSQMLHKIDPETSDTMFVAQLAEDTSPGGIHITHDWVADSWVFLTLDKIGTPDGGDQVRVRQLGGKTSWLKVDPLEGVIGGGDSEDLAISFDTRWLLADVFTADLVFTHNGRSESDTVGLEFEVIVLTPPAAPTDLTAIEETPRLVSLNWTDNAVDEIGYTIERLIEGEEEFSVLTELQEDAIAYIDTVETIYQERTYRIQSFNDAGISAFSDEISLTPLGSPPNEFDLREPGDESHYLFDPLFTDSLISNISWETSIDTDPEDTLSYELIFGLVDAETDTVIAEYTMELSDTTVSRDLLEVLVELGVNWMDGALGDRWTIRWYVSSISGLDRVKSTEEFDIILEVMLGADISKLHPASFGLHNVYPNPFNDVLRIDYGLESNTQASMVVYDLTGRAVVRLLSKNLQRGNYTIIWDASALPSGVYLISLLAAEKTDLKKVLLIR